MKIVREVQNAIDGKYTIVRDKNRKPNRETTGTTGFRETESRVVRKFSEWGLAIPQADEKPKP